MFAALNYLDGKLIARTEQRHTHVEWLRFLKQIERETPKQLDLHLIVDNYCTHKQQKVRKWLSFSHPLHPDQFVLVECCLAYLQEWSLDRSQAEMMKP